MVDGDLYLKIRIFETLDCKIKKRNAELTSSSSSSILLDS